MRALTVAVVVLVAGCPSRDPVPAGDAGAGGPDAPTGAVLELSCPVDMSSFPVFARDCAAPSDCAIALHQIDCCGTMAAHGIRADQVAAFNTAELACEAMFPGCGCASQPTQAEDGDNETMGTILVGCEGSVCLTYVP
jgi:hypothetical protein